MSSTSAIHEVNFDGLVGPTHHYGGLATGNEASRANRLAVSRPREAALQGLAKMKALHDLGLRQALLPPLERPAMHVLRRLGFDGPDDETILARARRDARDVLAACVSASSMWVANAATVTPSADTRDGRVHFTPANLATNLHRSIEAPDMAQVLRRVFSSPEHFVHHPPLAGGPDRGDEGAANHTRLGPSHAARGLHHFVYGRDVARPDAPLPMQYPARQTREASETVTLQHGLWPQAAVFTQQAPEAIDAGVFHNDVIATGNEHVFLWHAQAYVGGEAAVDELRQRYRTFHGGAELCAVQVGADELPLVDAVRSYLFNSQLVTLPGGGMLLVAPADCEDIPAARAVVRRLVEDPTVPITEARFFDLRQSMRNGGGPACLRLRVVLRPDEIAACAPGAFLDDAQYARLTAWVQKHYRETLTPPEASSIGLLHDVRAALDELTQILGLGSLYHFQR